MTIEARVITLICTEIQRPRQRRTSSSGVGCWTGCMLETVWLIISAMAFGGVIEYTGLLARLIQPVVKWAQGDRRLLVATGLTSIGVNVIAGDQYMAIVLPEGCIERYTTNEVSHQRRSRGR